MTATVVRSATPFDIPALVDMLRHYRAEAPLEFLRGVDDAQHVERLLAQIIAGRGVALVAQTDQVCGMLIASIAPSMWSLSHLVLTEMAFWVEPHARGGTSGHRLITEYIRRGNELKEQGRISAFFISKMVTSPDLRYERFGFKKLEDFWVI